MKTDDVAIEKLVSVRGALTVLHVVWGKADAVTREAFQALIAATPPPDRATAGPPPDKATVPPREGLALHQRRPPRARAAFRNFADVAARLSGASRPA